MKAQYDREGVEYMSDEMELNEKTGTGQSKAKQPNEKATTLSGARKPGMSSTGEMMSRIPSSLRQETETGFKNPINSLINATKMFT